MSTYKYAAAVADNAPNYFVVFAGRTSFGAPALCTTATEADAQLIVSALNARADFQAAMQRAGDWQVRS